MGNNISNNNEPSLLLQLFGKTAPKYDQPKMSESCLDYFSGGALKKMAKHINFDEDFISDKNKNDNEIIFKVSQLTKKMEYEEAKEKSKDILENLPNLHLGQIKLFFSELIFLTKYQKDATKVLYVGAAEGYHISKLADLFPNLMFDLWDPAKFKLIPRNNIKIYNYAFTIDDAKKYASQQEKILFMCDIRTISVAKLIKKEEEIKVDELIEDDMVMQADWIKIIEPVYAYLKFRLPWYSPTSKYLGGTIYLQPYSPLSSEARLMTNNYTDYIEYNNNDYSDKMSYFNHFIRPVDKYERWSNIFDKYNLLNNWDNALGLYIIDYYLRKIHNIGSDEETGKLFMDIINFHIDRYGKKYDVLFNKNK